MITSHQPSGPRRFVVFATMLLIALFAAQLPASSTAVAGAEVEPKPGSSYQPVRSSGETTTITSPAPGSKNAIEPVAHDPNGITHSTPAAPGTKNYSAEQASALDFNATANPSAWRFSACGQIQDGGWNTTSSSFAPVVSCTKRFPENGFVYIKASTSMGYKDGNYEARLNVAVDSTSGNLATDRWINAYSDSADGTDKNIDVMLLTPVSAGAHTFYFLGARYNGTGTVQLYDPSISVLYFPSSSADVLACGASGNLIWKTSEASFQTIRSCALNVPRSGFVYLSGSASAGLGTGGAYEGRFRVGVDSTTGTASSDRWVNVTTDSGDGTDEAVSTSLLTSVASGAHTFYFLGARYNGTGSVQVYDPTLSVLYFPAPNVTAKVCGAGGSDTWTNNTTAYSIIRSCTLNVPQNGFAFIDATASAGLNNTAAGNDWEGQFRIGVDNDTGSSLFDRWVNAYTDTGDGTDRIVSNSGLVNISKGVHTFYFVGRRYAGNGTVRLYSPSLTVIVPGARYYFPITTR